MAKFLSAALALVIGATAQNAMAEECAMDASDSDWPSGALEQWRISAYEDLGIGEVELPTVYAIDANCLYEFPEGDLLQISANAHGGHPTLPSYSQIPVAPVSFAFGKDQFVMSLPSVWRLAGVESEMGLEALMTGVLLHEIMHTMQSDLANEFLDPIGEEQGIGDDLSDDLLQERFSDVAGYELAFREETDLLFAAAASESDASARELAGHALHMMQLRRQTWFTGKNAYFQDLDDIFLTMEGAGQWLMYRYFLKLDEGAGSAQRALEATRRGGRRWSQDEGLALILVVDRLNPEWRDQAFTDPNWRAENLLASALAQ